MPDLRLGYKASAEQFHPQRLLNLAVAAEQAGFDSVWTSDHFQPWRHHDGHAPNALTWLGAATQATKRVILGTSVLTPSFRYNPAIVAQSFATLSCLAEDRVVLGVGTGESLNEVPVGIDWPEQSERFARLKEATQLIQQLWRTERLDFQGDYYRVHTATDLRPPQDPDPGVHRRVGPGGRPPRRPDRRRLHLHQRQGRRAVRRHAPAGARGGRDQGGPRRVDDGQDDRDEGLVRHRLRAGEGGHQGLGRARAQRRAEGERPRRARDGGAGQGGGAHRPHALARVGRRRRAPRAAPDRTSTTGSRTSCSTSRATTRLAAIERYGEADPAADSASAYG